jgi:hypothetical protein
LNKQSGAKITTPVGAKNLLSNGKKAKPKAPIELDDVNFSIDNDGDGLTGTKKTISNTI